MGWWKATGTTTWIFSNRMGSRRVQDTHVTIAAPIPEPMMDPRAPGDVRFLVGEDGDSTIGHSMERRDNMICHIFPTQEVLFLVAVVLTNLRSMKITRRTWSMRVQTPMRLGWVFGWLGFGFRFRHRGNSRSLHCLSRCCWWRVPSLVVRRPTGGGKKNTTFFLVVFPEMPS